MIKRLNIIFFIATFLISSCGSIQFLSETNRKDLYTEQFLNKVQIAKTTFAEGQNNKAILELKSLDSKSLLPSERSLKNNLIGVIYFGESKYEEALKSFEDAKSTSSLDKELDAQIDLNIASTKFKLGFIQSVLTLLKNINYKLLIPKEEKKYHKLTYHVSKLLDNQDSLIQALINYFRNDKNIKDIKSNSLYAELVKDFISLENQKAFNILNNNSSSAPTVIALIGIEKIKRYLIVGKIEDGEDLSKWLRDEFSELHEINQLLAQIKTEVDLDTTLDRFKIGVILPLSGSKSKYGLRALKSVTFAFEKIIASKENKFELIVKDSESSPEFGALKVLELVKKDHVAVILGGLSTKESMLEYEQSKQNGALFVSLSSLFIPSLSKNHLLIELPGSLESQFNLIGTDRFQKVIGSKIAIMYPKYNKGNVFFDEVWNRKDLLGVNIVDVASFEPKNFDFSKQVKNLLNLNFVQERSEEYEIFKKFKDEDPRNWRGRQLLQPNYSFDWVYVLSSSRQAMQIIPTFPYFDAKNIKIVGGPAWRSNNLIKQNYRKNEIYFIGDEFSEIKETEKIEQNELTAMDNSTLNFDQKYQKYYSKKPGLLEHLSFEGISIIANILNSKNSFTTRYDFSQQLEDYDSLKGFEGRESWIKFNSLWTKKMYLYKLSGRTVKKIL